MDRGSVCVYVCVLTLRHGHSKQSWSAEALCALCLCSCISFPVSVLCPRLCVTVCFCILSHRTIYEGFYLHNRAAGTDCLGLFVASLTCSTAVFPVAQRPQTPQIVFLKDSMLCICTWLYMAGRSKQTMFTQKQK